MVRRCRLASWARAGLVPAILAGLAAVYFLVLFVAQWLTGGSPLGG